MKFSVSLPALRAAAIEAGRFAMREGQALPVLSSLLLRFEHFTDTRGFVSIEGTSQDTRGGVFKIPASGLESGDGQVVLPASTLIKALKTLPEDCGTLEVSSDDSGKISIKVGAEEFILLGLDPDLFPVQGFEGKELARVTMKGKELAALFSRTCVAIPKKETRKVLLGGFLEIEEGKVQITGTDGKKLHFERIPEADSSGEAALIVPMSFMVAMAPSLEKLDKLVTLSVRAMKDDCRFIQVIIEGEPESRYWSTGIPGKYPQTSAVISKVWAMTYPVPREAMLKAVQRAKLLRSRTNSVLMTFGPSRIDLSCKTYDVGEFKTCVLCSTPEEVSGKRVVEAAFSAPYLCELLADMPGASFQFMLSSASSPAMMVFEGLDGFRVLMPVKLIEAKEDWKEPARTEEPEEEEEAAKKEDDEQED